MQKVEITIVVPERIAVLVQNYLQRDILVGGNSGFMFNLHMYQQIKLPRKNMFFRGNLICHG